MKGTDPQDLGPYSFLQTLQELREEYRSREASHLAREATLHAAAADLRASLKELLSREAQREKDLKMEIRELKAEIKKLQAEIRQLQVDHRRELKELQDRMCAHYDKVVSMAIDSRHGDLPDLPRFPAASSSYRITSSSNPSHSSRSPSPKATSPSASTSTIARPSTTSSKPSRHASSSKQSHPSPPSAQLAALELDDLEKHTSETELGCNNCIPFARCLRSRTKSAPRRSERLLSNR